MFKDYNMNQLVLPLDLEVKLQNNDIAFHIHHLVESIPHEAFEPFLRNEGCPAVFCNRKVQKNAIKNAEVCHPISFFL
ncbi:hypothetical protein ACH0B5_08840, partial [Ureibacillus sp. 179-F W5.1 NHS]